MSSTPSTTPGHNMPREHYLNATYGIRSWLLTTDHKRIALLYLAIGDLLLFHRRHFCHHDSNPSADPERLPGYARNLQQALHHARRGHDLFFPDPSIPAVLGNFLIPLMIGAKDLAFPKINLLSWYIYVVGGCFVSIRSAPAAWTPAGPSTRRSAASIPILP